MHPLFFLIGLMMASTFSVLVVMRREGITHLKSGWRTGLIVILGIPLGLFVFISYVGSFA
jgi:threonine/homoserine/homoserine lactone efflux protein